MVLPPALVLLYRTGFDWSAWETKVSCHPVKQLYVILYRFDVTMFSKSFKLL